MKIIKVDLNNETQDKFDEVKIIPIADAHIGDKTANLKKLKETIKLIQEQPQTYTIINGDLCNVALKNSKSDVYSDQMSPMEQINTLIELLEPIKDKILVMSSGNHENRITKETSIDVLDLVARELGIKDRYAPTWWYLYLRFGEKESGRKAPMVYTITGYHGSGGGGRKSGGKINRLEEMSQVVIADLYIMSHTHKPISTKGTIYVPDFANNAITKKEMHYLMTNSFLEYDNSYGEAMGFAPSNTGLTEATLDGHKRLVKTTL